MLKQYRRSGKVAYLDPIRGFLVEARPEETVRQEFLVRLMGEFAVPQSALEVEYPLRRSGSPSKQRADILIVGGGGPLMVIECKEPNTLLHDGVHEQARGYATILDCPYLALTNGHEVRAFHRQGDSWPALARFPAFPDMQAPGQLRYKPAKSRDFRPLRLDELTDVESLAEHDAGLSRDWGYCVLGEDTPKDLHTPIYSLYSTLFHRPDMDSYLPRERAGFRIEEYVGLHFTEYGNYSGGRFAGLYSSFRVKDGRGDDQIFKIGFFSTLHTENHPVWGNRKGTSGIHVAIDDFDRAPHMSLELSLDACLTRRPGRTAVYDVTHDGKITVGRLGAAKRDVLLEFVGRHAPELVRERSVVLGSFPGGRALTFGDIKDLVFNLLHYAEVRDRFRAQYKKRR